MIVRDVGVLVTLACLFLPLVASNYTVAQPAQTVPPVTYCLDCGHGVDWRTERPELGPVGTFCYSTWDRLNPAPGTYDWTDLDRQLALEDGLMVQIDGPEPYLIPKPVQISVDVSLWNPPRCYSPAWLGDDACLWLSCACGSAPIPNYKSARWQSALWEFVTALGAHYEDDPRVGSIVIGTVGVDGEAVLAKDVGDCAWRQAALQIPGLEYAWGQMVKLSIPHYRQAFPAKPLLFPIAAGGGARCVWADICAMQSPVVGLKHSGAWYDLPDWQVEDSASCCGAYTAFERHPELPAVIETKADLGTNDLAWALYGALSTTKADAAVVHPGYLDRLPDGLLRKFAATYGKGVATTPFAWIVFRDQEYPTEAWCDASGKMGDHEMWLFRIEGGTLYGLGQVPDGADAGWQGRQAWAGPGTLMLPAGFDTTRDCAAVISWYDRLAEPWAFTWYEGDKRRAHVVWGTGSHTWKEEAVTGMTVDASKPLGIDGEQLYHSVWVASWANLLNDPTPTPTQKATPTWTSTATPSPTWTATAAPMPTQTTTPTPTESTPFPTPTFTIDEEVHEFRVALQGRLFRDLGGFWVVEVSLWPATSTYPTLTP